MSVTAGGGGEIHRKRMCRNVVAVSDGKALCEVDGSSTALGTILVTKGATSRQCYCCHGSDGMWMLRDGFFFSQFKACLRNFRCDVNKIIKLFP